MRAQTRCLQTSSTNSSRIHRVQAIRQVSSPGHICGCGLWLDDFRSSMSSPDGVARRQIVCQDSRDCYGFSGRDPDPARRGFPTSRLTRSPAPLGAFIGKRTSCVRRRDCRRAAARSDPWIVAFDPREQIDWLFWHDVIDERQLDMARWRGLRSANGDRVGASAASTMASCHPMDTRSQWIAITTTNSVRARSAPQNSSSAARPAQVYASAPWAATSAPRIL